MDRIAAAVLVIDCHHIPFRGKSKELEMISRTLQNSLPWLESIILMDLPPKDPNDDNEDEEDDEDEDDQEEPDIREPDE
jgi:hypothetical protein